MSGIQVVRVGSFSGSDKDHDALENRNISKQHPIDAITDLRDKLNYLETNDKSIASLVNSLNGSLDFVQNIIAGISSGTNTGTTSPIYEVFYATQGQTIITLRNKYLVGTNSIDVFINGFLMKSNKADNCGSMPINYDYIEVDSKKISIIKPLDANDIVIVKNSVTNIKVSTSKYIEYENCVSFPTEKRIKKEIITGDIEKTIEYLYDNQDRIIEEITTQEGNSNSKYFTYDSDGLVSVIDNEDADVFIVHKQSYDKIGTSFREEHIATLNQTVFKLNHYYPIGIDALFVFYNGVLLSRNMYSEYDSETIETLFPCGKDDKIIVMLPMSSTNSISNKRIFNIENNLQLLCNHDLNTKYLHVTVWVDNKEFDGCVKEAIDDSNVLITFPYPITGTIVIS